MPKYLSLFTLLFWSLFASLASAQDRAWVQIEARPTLAQAEERARAYAGAFSDVAGFRMASGWYAIALGPYDPDTALSRLAQLRRDNLIPADSFVANGEQYRGGFWPLGQDPMSAPLNGAALPPPVVTAPLATAPQPFVEPVETLQQARRSEQALSPEARRDLQSALKWFGFYEASIDGAFGRGTRASMAAWQAANGHEPTGVMTTKQRAQIITERDLVVAELGLQTITEEEAGIEISLPIALVEFDHYEPPFVHFAEKDGSGVRVVLISEPGDGAALRGLYDILQTLEVVPQNGARSLNDRGFTIDGRDGTIASRSVVQLSGGLIKGYMLIWKPEAEDKARNALKAMDASFKTIGGRALDPGLVSLDDAQRRNLLAGMEVRRPKISRSGFFVSATGDVITTTETLQSCARITLDRNIEATITAQDDSSGLAVLTPVKPLAPRFIAEFADSPRIGTEVALAGYSYEDALPAPTLTFGALEDTKGLAGEAGIARLSLSSLPGDAGGPVMNGKGAVLGMLIPATATDGRVLPGEVSFVADVTSIKAILNRAGVAPVQQATRAAPLPPSDLTERAMSMTVLVSCWE
ncbi:peptidoglycan-binding protein (plasmid) [Pseudorhodobacter turbinis]|uniref:Peptidoglycan-binding protein n=1 Tax=Pseudorhodobacter turbinis TaxID=2500533 RepID=A0A4P8EJD7_9RHOB|nr:serine protease [Pseudorhodobacter turbinis]QCO57088.1 peptidoglycan-binding protein [Pseudorhodobacter turbinis]